MEAQEYLQVRWSERRMEEGLHSWQVLLSLLQTWQWGIPSLQDRHWLPSFEGTLSMALHRVHLAVSPGHSSQSGLAHSN